MPRYQTKRVYAAEKEYCEKYGVDMSREEIEDLVDRITRSKWWAKRCDVRSVEVTWRNRVWMWFYKPSKQMAIPPSRSVDEIEVTHELAHGVVWPRDGQPHHTPTWARAQLSLVGKWAGKEARLRLEKIYQEHGVEWRKSK